MTTVTIPVSDECERKQCQQEATTAYIVTGNAGSDGIAVYCDGHSEQWADPSENHTAIAEVEQ